MWYAVISWWWLCISQIQLSEAISIIIFIYVTYVCILQSHKDSQYYNIACIAYKSLPIHLPSVDLVAASAWVNIHQHKTFPSGRNGCVRVDAFHQSGHAPSKLSETPRWQLTPRPAPIPCVTLHITLQSQFRRFFSFCRYRIENWHCGVVANCDYTSEWVHWVYQQNVNRSGSHTQTSQTLQLPSPVLLSTFRCCLLRVP